MKEYQIIVGENTRHEIVLTAMECGRDLAVVICGGSRHHVGAVALGSGCLPDGSALKYSATVSSICALDHKDDAVARKAAALLADQIHGAVSVSVGIHVDQATGEDIRLLGEAALEACQKLIRLLS